MHLEKLKPYYPSIILASVLAAISILITYLVVSLGEVVAPLIVLSLMAIFTLCWIIKDYVIGIYFVFFLNVFMSFINRMLGGKIVPFGVVLDVVSVLAFIAMFFIKDKRRWVGLRSPITYAFTLIVIYQLLQAFNPNAVSITGWLVALRGNTSFLLFFVFFAMFASFTQVKRFTIVWLGLAAVVALYGIYQEQFGLSPKEMAWVHASPGRVDLLFIWGHLRKFSFLSDPSSFGLFMAFSGLASLAMAIGPFQPLHRMAFLFMGIIMLMSMGYSGTRTAFAMVAVGVAFYLVLTLRNRKTILLGAVVVVATILMLFGPFHGSTINRVRSTVNMNEDASMGVRDRKRIRLQEYVISHPIGGGLNTTGINGVRYSMGHPLALGFDPDSGYLMTALELGWIGLIIGLGFFFLVMLKGIQNYFELDDPLLKTITLAYIVPFMALSVAHYAQDAMWGKPVYMVIIATSALMIRLPSLQNRTLNT